jgi:hypothetical protein
MVDVRAGDGEPRRWEASRQAKHIWETREHGEVTRQWVRLTFQMRYLDIIGVSDNEQPKRGYKGVARGLSCSGVHCEHGTDGLVERHLVPRNCGMSLVMGFR